MCAQRRFPDCRPHARSWGAQGIPGACDPELLGLTRGHGGWDALPSTSPTVCAGSRTGKLAEVPIRCGPLDRGDRSPVHRPTLYTGISRGDQSSAKNPRTIKLRTVLDILHHKASPGNTGDCGRAPSHGRTKTRVHDAPVRCGTPEHMADVGSPCTPWQKRKC